MENTITTGQKNTATFIHLSVFAQFLFPLGNFIAPLLIWASLSTVPPVLNVTAEETLPVC